MTVSATTMSLLIKAQTPRPTVETASVQSNTVETDAEARQLVAAMARGDEEAFRKLYERHQRRVPNRVPRS